MKTNPFVVVALLGVAAIVTGESVLVVNHMDRTTASLRSRWHEASRRLDSGQVVTSLARVLVRAAQ